MTAKMTKSPPELVERFNALAELVPEAQRKLMFGYPSCTFLGNMFMSLFEDDLVLRLGDADRATLEERGGRPFEPMPGKPMHGYVVVPRALVDTEDAEDWVVRSFDHARTLPAKVDKKR